MKKTKLNIRFHNPNTEEETVQYIAKAGETGAGETGSDSYRCEDAGNGWTGFCRKST